MACGISIPEGFGRYVPIGRSHSRHVPKTGNDEKSHLRNRRSFRKIQRGADTGTLDLEGQRLAFPDRSTVAGMWLMSLFHGHFTLFPSQSIQLHHVPVIITFLHRLFSRRIMEITNGFHCHWRTKKPKTLSKISFTTRRIK